MADENGALYTEKHDGTMFSEIKIMSQEVYNEKVGPKSMKAQPNSVRGPGGTVDSTGSPSLLNDTAGTGDGKLWGQDGGG